MSVKLIDKVDQRLHGVTSGLGTAAFGAPFAAAGGYFLLVGAGVVEVPRGVYAPLWVVSAFGTAFALMGLSFIGMGLKGHRLRLAADRARRQHPDRPWLSDYPWRPGGVRDAPYRRALIAAGFAVFMLVFLIPFNWWAFASGGGFILLGVVVALFDFVALALLASALGLAIAALKYGYSQVAYGRFPFAPGEDLDLQLSPNRAIVLEATLRFVEERMVTVREGGKSRERYQAGELWRATEHLEPGDGTGAVSVRFTLPEDDALVSAMRGDGPMRYWELLVEARQPDVDFRTTFALPVYPVTPGDPARTCEPLPPLAPRRVPRLERHLAMALALALGLAAALAPGWVADQARSLWRLVEAPMVFEEVDDLESSMKDLVIGADGVRWALAERAAYRLPPELDAAPERVFEVPEEMAWTYLQSFLVSRRGVLWLGGSDGEVMTYDDRRLRVHASAEDGLSRAIESIVEFGDDLYVGANGVWRLPGRAGPAVRAAAIPERLTESFAVDGPVLYAGVAQALWRLDESGWNRVLVIPRGHGTISAIVLVDDAILLGTFGGLLVYDRAGELRQRPLAGYDVRRILVDGDRLWLATGNHGLVLGPRSGDGEWLTLDARGGLPHEDLRAIALDGSGRLWTAFLGAGVTVAEIDQVIALMTPPLP